MGLLLIVMSIFWSCSCEKYKRLRNIGINDIGVHIFKSLKSGISSNKYDADHRYRQGRRCNFLGSRASG